MHAAPERLPQKGSGETAAAASQRRLSSHKALAGSSPLHQAGRLPCPSGSSSGAGQPPGRAWRGELPNPGVGQLLEASLSSQTAPEQTRGAAKLPRHPLAIWRRRRSAPAGRQACKAPAGLHCDSTRDNRALTTLRCAIHRWMAVRSRFGHSQLSASGALAAERRTAQDLSYGGIGLAASSSDAGFRQVGRHPPAHTSAGAHLLSPRRGHRLSPITYFSG